MKKKVIVAKGQFVKKNLLTIIENDTTTKTPDCELRSAIIFCKI